MVPSSRASHGRCGRGSDSPGSSRPAVPRVRPPCAAVGAAGATTAGRGAVATAGAADGAGSNAPALHATIPPDRTASERVQRWRRNDATRRQARVRRAATIVGGSGTCASLARLGAELGGPAMLGLEPDDAGERLDEADRVGQRRQAGRGRRPRSPRGAATAHGCRAAISVSVKAARRARSREQRCPIGRGGHRRPLSLRSSTAVPLSRIKPRKLRAGAALSQRYCPRCQARCRLMRRAALLRRSTWAMALGAFPPVVPG